MNTYHQTVEENLKQMNAPAHEWSAVAVSGMSEVDAGNGEMRLMPNFDFPQGYKAAPSMFAGQDKACHLCGTTIKNFFWIKNDEKKWTMPVGCECVTHFGEGLTGKQQAKKDVATINRDFVRTLHELRGKLKKQFSYDRSEIKGGKYTGRTFREWALHTPGAGEAKRLYDNLMFTLGNVTHLTSKIMGEEKPIWTDRQIANWLAKNGDKAREVAAKINSHMAEYAKVVA